MTAQVPERLLHRGRELNMCARPLDPYLEKIRKTRRPCFYWMSTACHRGYVGHWEIRDGMLLLTGMECFLETEAGVIAAGLEQALPWLKPPVPATWFTGELRCPEGRCLQYVHQAFASTYERDRLFYVNRGRIEDELLRLNPPPPILYRIEADGRRTCLDGPDPLGPEDDLDLVGYKVWGTPPADEDSGYIIAGCYIRGLPDNTEGRS